MSEMNLKQLRKSLSTDTSSKITNHGKAKKAAVLAIVFGNPPKIIMTKKSRILKIHAGEISFPGGKWDKEDKDLLDTAIRETREEINLSLRRDQIIGKLKPVTTLNSGFIITPFVAVVNRLPRLKDNPEVETILPIPLNPFLKTLADDTDPKHKFFPELYTFTFEEHIVWGASARILKEMVDILRKDKLI